MNGMHDGISGGRNFFYDFFNDIALLVKQAVNNSAGDWQDGCHQVHALEAEVTTQDTEDVRADPQP